MVPNAPATRTYTPIQFTVLPGSAARGGILALFYLPVSLLLVLVLREVVEETALEPVLSGFLGVVGWGGVAALGFMLPIALSVFLAWLGYRSREYEVGPEGVTERRGILARPERLLTYEELEGVTVTESVVQSLYGAGTVLLTDVNRAEDEQVVMKLSYIENPEEVSTSILRHLGDVTGATDGRLETRGIGELDVDSASVSRLSGDDLAAGTGFRYLMPTAILHPRPGKAALYGCSLGLGSGLLGGALLIHYRDAVMGITGLPSMASYLVSLGLGAASVTALFAGYFYWTYDRTQYELYEDHVRVIRGEQTTSLSIDDVADVTLDANWLGWAHGIGAAVLPWTDGGHIALLDDRSDELLEMSFIGDAGAVFEALEVWLVETEREAEIDEGAAPAGTVE